MYCPLHRHQLVLFGQTCPLCEKLGFRVEVVEIDKISRAVDTLHEQGFDLTGRSFAVLVFDQAPERPVLPTCTSGTP